MTDKNVDVAELVKQHAELGDQIVKLGGKVTYPENDDAKLKAKKGAPERVKLDKAKAASDGDAEEPDFDEDDDANGKDKKPMKKEEEKVIEKAKDKDIEKVAEETVVFKGQTIKKSVVGVEQFGIFKSMADELTKASTDIAKANDDALMARLEKRAGDEFSHVPGSVQERASMLKALGAMDEPLRKTFEAVFASAEKLAKTAFDTVGSGGGDSENIKKSKQDFDGKVNEIVKRDGVKRAEALTKARQEFPDLFKAYQEAN